MMKTMKYLMFGVIGIVLTGCAGLTGVSTKRFLLDPGEPPSFAGMRSGGSAAVSYVDVALPFGGGGFTYQATAYEWETDPYNGFLVAPSQMMTEIVRKWVSDSDLYASVAVAGDPAGQDRQIRVTVSELYGDFQSLAPRAMLKLDVRVFRNRGGDAALVSSASYAQEVPIERRTPEALVAGWNEGLRQALLAMSKDLAGAGR
jgi:uncharacterized lipoprotein YmbA